MTLARIALGLTLAFITLTWSVSARASESADPLAELRETDKAEFNRLSEATSDWAGDEAEMTKINADLDRLSAKYPDSVPIKVQTAIAQWIRYSNGMGLVLGGRSYLPVFLEHQKLAPDYPKPYIMAARAYIHTSDFEGAKPSLQKASALAPDDPWADLAWALWHGRKIDRPRAIESARLALSKSAGDARAISNAIIVICQNLGIRDIQEAEALVQKVFEVESDPSTLTTVARRTLGSGPIKPVAEMTIS